MTDKWDLDPESIEGIIARPYYIQGYWKPGEVFDKTDLEQSIITFVSSRDDNQKEPPQDA